MGATLNDVVVLRYYTGLTIGINESLATVGALEVHPNPMGNSVTLTYTLQRSGTVTIHLLDMQGRLVATFADHAAQGAGEQRLILELPRGIAPGSYLLTLSTANGDMARVQVVKE
ncbi:MAG: T9SS type A sorting domain-containing protein [Flavobacteriales bacterium]